MAKMRVHELAKEIDKTSKDIITCLERAGVEGKTASSSLEDDQIAVIKKQFVRPAQPAAKPVEAAVPKPAVQRTVSPAQAQQQRAAEQKPAGDMVKKKKSNIIFVSNPHNSQQPGRSNAGYGQRVTTGTPVRPGSQQNARPQQAPVRPSAQAAQPVSRPAAQPVNRPAENVQSTGGDQNRQVHTQTQAISQAVKTDVQRSNNPAGVGSNSDRDNRRTEGYRDQAGERVRQPYQGNRDGQYQNRDGQNNRSGQYQSRDGQNNRGGQYQSRDGQGNRSGQYQSRDGQNNRGGQYQSRDGQGARPSQPYGQGNRSGQYQSRDGQGARPGQPYGQGNRGGQYQNRDGQGARPAQPYGQGNRGGQYQSRDGQGNRSFQSGGRGAGAGFTPDAKETAKEQEKHRDEQEKRRQNQDKRKKEHTFSAEDGFRGGKAVKGAKVAKLERPQERKEAVKEEEKIKVIVLPEMLTIKELAEKMKIQPAIIIKKLFLQGKIVTVNQEITFEQAEEIAMEFEILCEREVVVDVIEELLKEEEEDTSQMTARPPVICVMGHVDHGKTSLLDAIRKTHVIDKEAGGITQHIGAYVVNINGQKITFLDTPGHEAFTAMRMRGANATDIAILVVAADDGVMPQTIEAINHAKAAGIEIIVAVNKIDKPSANIDRVKQELSEYELVPEDWGGSTVFAPVSAKSGEGIEQLLEMILLTAEILELKADVKRKARGLVIEAQLDKGRGPVATVLVQKGTLKVGDFIAAGACYGKVRAMIDDKGKRVKEAPPSTPVEILGLNDVPNAGEIFVSPESDKEARNFAATFISQNKVKLLDDTKAKMSLDDLFTQIKAGNLKELNLIIKADVQGSVEAVKESLLKLTNEEVVVKVIHGGVGAINESDVILASASNAIIIGFNVRPDVTAKATAETEGVDVRLYSVIYKAIEDVEAAMKGMLDPVFEEKVIGHAEIRQIFKSSGIGNIAGSYVLDGIFQRNCTVRISREGKQIFEGKLASLKRFKDDVKEVKAGFECGLVFEEFHDFAELDIVEAYIMVEVPR